MGRPRHGREGGRGGGVGRPSMGPVHRWNPDDSGRGSGGGPVPSRRPRGVPAPRPQSGLHAASPAGGGTAGRTSCGAGRPRAPDPRGPPAGRCSDRRRPCAAAERPLTARTGASGAPEHALHRRCPRSRCRAAAAVGDHGQAEVRVEHHDKVQESSSRAALAHVGDQARRGALRRTLIELLSGRIASLLDVPGGGDETPERACGHQPAATRPRGEKHGLPVRREDPDRGRGSGRDRRSRAGAGRSGNPPARYSSVLLDGPRCSSGGAPRPRYRNRSPGAARRPVQEVARGEEPPPAGRKRRMRSTPDPQATSIPSAPAARTVPGEATTGAEPTPRERR